MRRKRCQEREAVGDEAADAIEPAMNKQPKIIGVEALCIAAGALVIAVIMFALAALRGKGHSGRHERNVQHATFNVKQQEQGGSASNSDVRR